MIDIDRNKKLPFSFSDFTSGTFLNSVGIDLTGSEKKASGWCALRGDLASTSRLYTNEDLINQTVSANPAVVSIDSPLSLPFGRLSVFDDDPGRAAFGITRTCERMMSKRGIRSYPPLIRSMQQLTLRGIKLAHIFRSLGYTVIESFPGAAQDILGIPRKQKDLPQLINGLQQFGLKGNFSSELTSHDEIDAITAALVGHFFTDNKYEAIGTLEEGYLILPKCMY
ncbi:DUF429 domain-containing protein [Pedobacter sp. BMA]|uniref:DUF429 domain-containing protein n=1 Tax=Pedobacter sp. BMA TaxID=1663685 RepID=UPI00069DBC6A|nr:DUF429 domain-containing protein [Pedobacter sp. BMA]